MLSPEAKKVRAEYMREYRAKNQDKIRQYNKNWREKNQIKLKIIKLTTGNG